MKEIKNVITLDMFPEKSFSSLPEAEAFLRNKLGKDLGCIAFKNGVSFGSYYKDGRYLKLVRWA